MKHDLEFLENAVKEALCGKRCVSAWLGYGNALFLGFGAESLPQRTPEGRHTVPPYELQTSIAEWRLCGDFAADQEDESGSAEQAVSALVGSSVVHWQLTAALGLEIEFEDTKLLKIETPSEIDPEDADLDWWWFCMPGSLFVGVGPGGQVVSGRTDKQTNGKDAEPPFAGGHSLRSCP